MPCIPLKSAGSKRQSWLCMSGPFYRCEGYTFEVHSYFGPIPLKDLDPIPKSFWDMWKRFDALSPEAKTRYAI